MRTLVITQNVTLDGAIEMLGDWFDPRDQTPDLLEAIDRFSAREDALLLGRRTFEDFRGFWPEQTDDQTGITAILNRVPKFVVSSTLGDPAWENSTVLGADWLEMVRALKAVDGDEIGVTGSITLCHALLRADLVDERVSGRPGPRATTVPERSRGQRAGVAGEPQLLQRRGSAAPRPLAVGGWAGLSPILAVSYWVALHHVKCWVSGHFSTRFSKAAM